MIHEKSKFCRTARPPLTTLDIVQGPGKGFSLFGLMTRVLLQHVTNSSCCQKLNTWRKWHKDLQMDQTHHMTRPPRWAPCLCAHNMDNWQVGAGEWPWAWPYSQEWTRTPSFLPKPFILWKLANKSKLIPAAASTTGGMDRMRASVMSSVFHGVGRAQLCPTLRFGRAGSPLVSQQPPGFLFILNLMGEWQQSSWGFPNELRRACSWELESLANSPQ